MARKIPISRVRCVTLIARTLAIPKATDKATKKVMIEVDKLCEANALTSCALVSIQLSALSPVRREILAAVASAANRSCTVKSIRLMPP